MHARPFDGRFQVVGWQAESKDFLRTRCRSKFFLQPGDIRQIDVMLINYQPVEFHHTELCRDGVEAVLDEGITQELFAQ